MLLFLDIGAQPHHFLLDDVPAAHVVRAAMFRLPTNLLTDYGARPAFFTDGR